VSAWNRSARTLTGHGSQSQVSFGPVSRWPWGHGLCDCERLESQGPDPDGSRLTIAGQASVRWAAGRKATGCVIVSVRNPRARTLTGHGSQSQVRHPSGEPLAVRPRAVFPITWTEGARTLTSHGLPDQPRSLIDPNW